MFSELLISVMLVFNPLMVVILSLQMSLLMRIVCISIFGFPIPPLSINLSWFGYMEEVWYMVEVLNSGIVCPRRSHLSLYGKLRIS